MTIENLNFERLDLQEKFHLIFSEYKNFESILDIDQLLRFILVNRIGIRPSYFGYFEIITSIKTLLLNPKMTMRDIFSLLGDKKECPAFRAIKFRTFNTWNNLEDIVGNKESVSVRELVALITTYLRVYFPNVVNSFLNKKEINTNFSLDFLDDFATDDLVCLQQTVRSYLLNPVANPEQMNLDQLIRYLLIDKIKMREGIQGRDLFAKIISWGILDKEKFWKAPYTYVINELGGSVPIHGTVLQTAAKSCVGIREDIEPIIGEFDKSTTIMEFAARICDYIEIYYSDIVNDTFENQNIKREKLNPNALDKALRQILVNEVGVNICTLGYKTTIAVVKNFLIHPAEDAFRKTANHFNISIEALMQRFYPFIRNSQRPDLIYDTSTEVNYGTMKEFINKIVKNLRDNHPDAIKEFLEKTYYDNSTEKKLFDDYSLEDLMNIYLMISSHLYPKFKDNDELIKYILAERIKLSIEYPGFEAVAFAVDYSLVNSSESTPPILEMYSLIAENTGITRASVDRRIRLVIESCLQNQYNDDIIPSGRELSNKELIAYVTDYIRVFGPLYNKADLKLSLVKSNLPTKKAYT